MGAGQSTGNDGEESTSSGKAAKTSYYELLGLSKEATEDEIKKAYRRKALELHPDRNYGKEEHATTLFAEIQSAYEVLSDPQERAWYDSHEDAILRDIDPHDVSGPAGRNNYEKNVGLTTADDLARLFRKFNAKTEFTDESTGFYGFLRETFEQLAREEAAAVIRDGGYTDDVPEYPSFGRSDDDDIAVRRFYGVWSAFSTRKSFAWRDKYRTTDAENRWIRRQVEKENRRFREEGAQSFNEAVRALVAFVKKRDPRFKADTRSEQERQQTLRDAARYQAARMKAANEAMMAQELPEWAMSRESQELDDLEGTIDESESEEEQYECVACRKTFKSEPQFEAHERSKKHAKNVHALRKKMLQEGHILLDEEAEEEAEASLDDGRVNQDIAHQETESQTEAPAENRERKFTDPQEDPVNALSHQTSDLDLSSEDDPNASPPLATPTHRTPEKALDDDDDDNDDSPDNQSEDDTNQTPAKQTRSVPKQGKAAQKRAKKAAQQESLSDPGLQHKCSGCNAAFPSKTRLFQHLSDHPGHASLKNTGQGGGGKKAKKKKK